MGKSSKTVSLALIGSALFLAGCAARNDEDDNDPQGAHASGGHGGVHVVPMFRGVGSGGGGGGAASSGVSARGGFGGTGASSGS